jgi:putative protein-disulfide isomerase
LRQIAVVQTHYYTDPACPWSWALEPTLRRLLQELGASLEITYVMCGMRRELQDPEEVTLQALEAGAQSGMPIDARLWLQDPPRSSHPACIAVKAAAEQGDPGPYLRRLREGLFCRGRKLDNADALTEAAREVGGLDLERFGIDLRSHATLEAFAADLERAQSVPAEHHAAGSDRVKLPSFEFRGADGAVHGVYGYSDYATLSDAALAAGALPTGDAAPSVEQALGRWGSMAAVEVASVCRLPGPRAPAELWRLASEWRVRVQDAGGGELWSLA